MLESVKMEYLGYQGYYDYLCLKSKVKFWRTLQNYAMSITSLRAILYLKWIWALHDNQAHNTPRTFLSTQQFTYHSIRDNRSGPHFLEQINKRYQTMVSETALLMHLLLPECF
jgi:hypothetical protein